MVAHSMLAALNNNSNIKLEQVEGENGKSTVVGNFNGPNTANFHCEEAMCLKRLLAKI